MLKEHSSTASALIMVIVMISLMISVAIGFMSMISRQRGSAINIAAQTKSDVALLQAQAHAIKCFLNSAAATSPQFSTMFNETWRTEFTAVTNPDGDPFTDDGVAKNPGTLSSLVADNNKTSVDPLVNAKHVLFDMIGIDSDKYYGSTFGYGFSTNAEFDYALSRWHNIEYLTDAFAHIDIDPTATAAQQTLLRKSAHYVVRYTVQVLDANAMRSINHNFPVDLQSGDSINPGTGTVDSTHYIRFQNYLRCYGRSAKSQFSSSNKDFAQFRSVTDENFTTVDPLDHENVSVLTDGTVYGSRGASSPSGYSYSAKSHHLSMDPRLRLERAFRNGDLHWLNGRQGNTDFCELTPGHNGKIYTWGHISESWLSTSGSSGYDYTNAKMCWIPYADSMQDVDLADPALVTAGVVAPAELSTPWRVNLLSASDETVSGMLLGLSSELSYSNGATQASCTGQADLFGKAYPEPFPLALDAGRYVPVMGEADADNKADAPNYYGFGLYPYNNSGSKVFARTSVYANAGNQNSYVFDVIVAVALAIRDARRVWVEEKSLYGRDTATFTAVDDANVSYRSGNFSKLDANETDPAVMLNQILLEAYRILGEDIGNSTSLLSGDKSYVGAGIKHSNTGVKGHYQRYVQLPDGTTLHDTRAMEYVLNDIMISLFGEANPNYSPADPANPSALELGTIALDFNGDTHVESTITGYHDYKSSSKKWSWWWDGLGPYVNVDYDYMKNPAWYRFDGLGDIERKVNHQWLSLSNSEKEVFASYNDIWLYTSGDPKVVRSQFPIKPFA
ncbi:MAG: hypothetical protein HRU15_17505, partial [Planctomycetes bacterium]|nr:hypothetical protein [Planctomycetota bacterium]